MPLVVLVLLTILGDPCCFSSSLPWFHLMGDLGLSSFSLSVSSSDLLSLSSMPCFVLFSKSYVPYTSLFPNSSFIFMFSGSILEWHRFTWASICSPFSSNIIKLWPFCNKNFAFSGLGSLTFLYQKVSFVILCHLKMIFVFADWTYYSQGYFSYFACVPCYNICIWSQTWLF